MDMVKPFVFLGTYSSLSCTPVSKQTTSIVSEKAREGKREREVSEKGRGAKVRRALPFFR
jgi:hypothetical protein